jgi:hypothetical protein
MGLAIDKIAISLNGWSTGFPSQNQISVLLAWAFLDLDQWPSSYFAIPLSLPGRLENTP